jgi:hypothetical protein
MYVLKQILFLCSSHHESLKCQKAITEVYISLTEEEKTKRLYLPLKWYVYDVCSSLWSTIYVSLEYRGVSSRVLKVSPTRRDFSDCFLKLMLWALRLTVYIGGKPSVHANHMFITLYLQYHLALLFSFPSKLKYLFV